MIEKILLSIAKRGSRSVSNFHSSLDAPSSLSPVSRLPQIPINTRANADATAQANLARPELLHVWQMACAAHVAALQQLTTPRVLPFAFKDYVAIDADVGALAWEERHKLGKRIIHVLGANKMVVAVISPRSRKVWLRKGAGRSGIRVRPLLFQELPESATELDEGSAKEFDETTLYMLFWYCGQVWEDATGFVPPSLIGGRMVLKKLPLISPTGLELRHLELFRIFRQGAHTFAELMALSADGARPLLCADLTSLYMCGALASADT